MGEDQYHICNMESQKEKKKNEREKRVKNLFDEIMAENFLNLKKEFCSPPGSTVHGILQARILERGAIHFSRWSFQPRNETQFPALKADSSLSEPPGSLQKAQGAPDKMTWNKSTSDIL